MSRHYWLLALVLLQPGCLLTDSAGRTSRKPDDAGLLPRDESAKACQAVAATLAAQGHHEQAIDQLVKAREFDANCDVSPSLARLYARAGKEKAARDEFDRALQAHPHDADLLNDAGYFQYQRANWAGAEAYFLKATVADAKLARAWNNLGMALAQQGKYPESLEAFEKAVKPAEARCNVAFILMAQGKREMARELYNEALKLDAGLTLARQAMARLDAAAAKANAVTPPGGTAKDS